jgi:ABC-type antimicrobial peptide transport system permease subunit
MRLLLIEHIQNARSSLKSTRLRTLLTTLGVAIGVASITVILSLASGITNVISKQVESLGGNIAVIRPGVISKTTPDFSNPVSQQMFSTSTITEEDVEEISKLDGVQDVAPLMIINSSPKSGQTTVNNATVLATTPSFISTANLTIRDGQFIDSVTNQDTAVIGPQLSINLFGTDQPIGKTFTARGQTFTIIGVLQRTNDPVNFSNVDFDNAAIISLESGKSFHRGIAQIQQINIRAESVTSLQRIIKEAESKLIKNHQGEKDFTILTGNEVAAPTSQLFIAVTAVMTAIAAISLIVGGVGIMNIMLVGVVERTREIGLRKSVGASNGNIIWQFMIEALIISLLGGILGYVGGYIIAFAISTFLTFDPAINWEIAVAALGTSLVVGLIFGLYPAIRAARKDPIESLRQYH